MDEPLPVTRDVDLGTAKLLPDIDRRRAWLLTLDGVPQSYVDLEEPTHLSFEYARWVAYLLDAVAAPGRPLDVLHLGAGALTLPRYLAATRPGSPQGVVEVDQGLIALVTEWLPLPQGQPISLRHADARDAVESLPAASAEVVVADVYGGRRVPAHLTSVEYTRAVARVLRPSGVYIVNLADSAPFGFLRPQLATLGTVFPQLCLVAEPATLRGRRYGNAVLAASRRQLPTAEVARRAAADAFPARVEHGASLERFVAGAAPVWDADATPSPEPPGGTFSVG